MMQIYFAMFVENLQAKTNTELFFLMQ